MEPEKYITPLFHDHPWVLEQNNIAFIAEIEILAI